MKVFVGKYDHKHGTDLRVFTTKAQAEGWRFEIADEWWEKEFPGKKKPRTKVMLVQDYWDSIIERESFSVNECLLEGAE